MIVRKENDDELMLITQTDHSRLVGQLAARWGNGKFAAPVPSVSVARAATFHDFGWLRYETDPEFDLESGETPDFKRVPNSNDQLDGYAWCCDWLLARDPYAALIVDMHRTGLWRGRYGTISHPANVVARKASPEIEAYIAAREAHQKAAISKFDQLEVWTNYRLLQVWDLLGLYFCCQDPYEHFIEPVPVSYGDEKSAGVRMSLAPAGKDKVAFDPYPFEQPSCRIQLTYKKLCQQKFDNRLSFQQAYFQAETRLMEFELVEG